MRANTAIERPSAWDDASPLISIGGPASEVFRARARESDRALAVRLWCGTSSDEIIAARERVEQAKRVSHPMLAAVEGCEARGNAALWIVSEYVPGPTLEAWASGGRVLPVPAAIDFMRRLSLGVQAALAQGVCHHAINPRNIVVWRQDPKAGLQLDGKLLDLGLAAWMCPEQPQLDCAHFMAPETLSALFDEQNVSDAFGARANVYSCGALLYFLSTGELPYRSLSIPQLMAAQAAGTHELVRPSAYNEQISPALECVILGALAVRAGERYASPGEFASVLDAVELRHRRATLPPPEAVAAAVASAPPPSAAAEPAPLSALEHVTQPSAAGAAAAPAESDELEEPTHPTAAAEPDAAELAAAAQLPAPPSAATELTAQAALAAFAAPASAADRAVSSIVQPPELAVAALQPPAFAAAALQPPALAAAATQPPALAAAPLQPPALTAAATQPPALAAAATQLPSLAAAATQLPSLAAASAQLPPLGENSAQLPPLPAGVAQLPLLGSSEVAAHMASAAELSSQLSAAFESKLAAELDAPGLAWGAATEERLSVAPPEPFVPRARVAARPWLRLFALSIGLGVYFCFPSVTRAPNINAAMATDAIAVPQFTLDAEPTRAQPAPPGAALPPAQPAEHNSAKASAPLHASAPQHKLAEPVAIERATLAHVRRPAVSTHPLPEAPSAEIEALSAPATPGFEALQPAHEVLQAAAAVGGNELEVRSSAPAQPTTGEARIKALEVRGSLTTSAVRRAMERVRPHWTACYEQIADASAQSAPVHFALVIDEAGRARDPHVSSAGPAAFAECLSRATSKLNAEKPDTGTVDVLFDLHFER
jgi:hypothetical protein